MKFIAPNGSAQYLTVRCHFNNGADSTAAASSHTNNNSNGSSSPTCTNSRSAFSPATGARSHPVANCKKERFSSIDSDNNTDLP